MASGTPSAQVRIPVTDLFFSTPTSARTKLLVEKYPAAENLCGGKKFSDSGIFIQGGHTWTKNLIKNLRVPKIVA